MTECLVNISAQTLFKIFFFSDAAPGSNKLPAGVPAITADTFLNLV